MAGGTSTVSTEHQYEVTLDVSRGAVVISCEEDRGIEEMLKLRHIYTDQLGYVGALGLNKEPLTRGASRSHMAIADELRKAAGYGTLAELMEEK